MRKKWIALVLCAVMAFVLAACGNNGGGGGGQPQPSGESGQNETTPPETGGGGSGSAQGITDTEILVGNTAATTGAYATVGVPFNAGMEAAFKEYNDLGGFDGRSIRLIHYDDGFDAANAVTYTKTLVETDQVFAVVGHFGTNTVGATLDYLKEKGIPMVYAATGISELYQEGATGNAKCIFPVQPIYDAEGRVLLARALASEESGKGLGGKKIGVISTTDDAGEGMVAGIKRQAEEGNFDIVYQEVQADAADFSAAVTVLKNAGCDVVILAMNQAPLVKAMNSMRDAEYNCKCITSYVNSSATTLGDLVASGAVTDQRPIYTTAWLDTGTDEGMADYMTFATVMATWEAANGIDSTDPAQTYVLNSYAMAGYIAGRVFIQGLDKVKEDGAELTWENYIKALEEFDVKIPMGGQISYSNGDRLGITDLALNMISLEPDAETGMYYLITVDHISPLDEIWTNVTQ